MIFGFYSGFKRICSKLYRQNVILNDFVNFLKARGRFREIEFIDNSVHATPRIPDLPSLVFYIEESHLEQEYVLEIHGDESSVMNREIQEFFQLNKLNIKKIRIKNYLKTTEDELLSIEVEGIGTPFDELINRILDLLEAQQYVVTDTQKTLIFGMEEENSAKPQKIPSQISIRSNLRTQATQIEPSPVIQPTEAKPSQVKILSSQKVSKQSMKKTDQPNQSLIKKVEPSKPEIISPEEEKEHKHTITHKVAEKLTTEESLTQKTEADIFHPSAPEKDYSNDIAPYLKQSTSLFRRDNWEEDLPTEIEMEILERTYSRIKHRTKPEILSKDIDIPVDEAEEYLRSLIKKGLLRTQVGWFIIKKSHLPFFKRTFADSEKKKKKKKSVRISRIGEGLTNEEIATIKAIKSRPNLKAQSNLLTRPTGLKQSVLKEVLRNLVDKGILRVSYGWYILKDKNILEHKRGSELPDSTKKSLNYQIPQGLKLSVEEEKVIQALLQRPQFKAQSNLLVPEVKMPKEQIKQILRDLVEKDVCKVTYGWYMLKEPKQFQVP
jgi:hypothetical protein